MKKTRRGIRKRYHWLTDIIHKNNFHIGAEVGCDKGNTTWRLLDGCPDLLLYAVDLWDYDDKYFSKDSQKIYKEWNFKERKDEFDRQTDPYKDRLIVLQGESKDMAKRVDDNSLDFVFIDADHSYGSVRADINRWTPKLKKKGILSGHDINIPGVWAAVRELTYSYEKTVDNVWYCRKEDVKHEDYTRVRK